MALTTSTTTTKAPERSSPSSSPGVVRTSTQIVTGGFEPFGLAFESNTELLVTDINNDALYRITGAF